MQTRANSCPRHRFKWGILAGVALGVSGSAGAVYLYCRHRASRHKEVQLEGPSILPPFMTPATFLAPEAKKAGVAADVKAVMPNYANPTIRSYVLPAPGADSIRLVSSSDRPYTVMLRVVDPAGSFGMFSFDPSTLNSTTPIPTGENIIIPSGQWQTVPLAPHSALYGRGSVTGVTVSVTGSPVGRPVEKIRHSNEIKPVT